MGKKSKKSSKVQRSASSTLCDNFTSLEDEIIQHLQFLREAGCLVIGLNAVLRGLKKKSFSVVILNSRKATSAMYRALNMMCKDTDVIFLKLQDINSVNYFSKIPSSTAYGIKVNVFTEQQKFGKLIVKINQARHSQKPKKQKNVEIISTSTNSSVSGENLSCAMDSEYSENVNDNSEINNPDLSLKNQCSKIDSSSLIHSNHNLPVIKFSRSDNGFLTLREIDFPNYNFRSNEISFHVE